MNVGWSATTRPKGDRVCHIAVVTHRFETLTNTVGIFSGIHRECTKDPQRRPSENDDRHTMKSPSVQTCAYERTPILAWSFRGSWNSSNLDAARLVPRPVGSQWKNSPVQTGDGECHAIYDTHKCLPEIPCKVTAANSFLKSSVIKQKLDDRLDNRAGECDIEIHWGFRANHCHCLAFKWLILLWFFVLWFSFRFMFLFL